MADNIDIQTTVAYIIFCQNVKEKENTKPEVVCEDKEKCKYTCKTNCTLPYMYVRLSLLELSDELYSVYACRIMHKFSRKGLKGHI